MIVPSEIDLNEIDRELTKTFTNLVDEAEDQFKKSYFNWEPQNQPTFITDSEKGENWVVEYFTVDNPYVWLDDGTPPHKITAKNPSGFMSFTWPYKARTKPGVLGSGTSSFGNNFAKQAEVNHPGVDARNFSELVVDELPIDKAFTAAFVRMDTI